MKLRYIILIICIVSGYFIFNYFYIDDNKIKQDMIKQLNKKYNDKFYIYDFISKDESLNFYQAYFFSDNYPGNSFYAVCKVENYKCHVYDNYQRYIYNEEIEIYINDSLTGIYNNYKLFLDLDDDRVLDKKYGNVNDYLSGQTISISLFVSNLEYSKKKNNIETLRKKFESNNLKASITLMYINDDKLKGINEENYKYYAMTLEDIDSYSIFSMNDEFQFDYNMWED